MSSSRPASSKYVLYGAPGTGSAIAEAMLALGEHPFENRELDYEQDVIGGSAELKSLNPLLRVPTLILPHGETLTESGAIAMYLGTQTHGERLVPRANSREFPAFLRMLFLLNSEIYPTFTYSDDPSEWVRDDAAQAELRQSIRKFRFELWTLLDGWLSPHGHWALGAHVSAVDIYLAVMVNWGPGRTWFQENFHRVSAIADRASEHPVIGPVLARNFPATPPEA